MSGYRERRRKPPIVDLYSATTPQVAYRKF